MKQTRLYCQDCGKKTLFAKGSIGAGWGCLLTIITAGGFLLIWPLLFLLGMFFDPWKCQTCGTSRH